MTRQSVSPIQEPFGFAAQPKASDYYPFGMAHTVEISSVKNGKAMEAVRVDPRETDESKTFTRSNAYLYNGKEEQPMPGKWLDYGARFYDAQLGRWHSVDPMAEAFANQTPYNFTLNNPINSIDPNGMYTLTVNGRKLKGSEKQRYQDSHGLPDDGPDEDEKRPEPTFSGYLSFLLKGIKDAFTFDIDTKNQKTQENLERKSENIANAIILIETTAGIISVLVPFSSVAELAAKIEAGHGLAALAAVPFVVLDAVPAGKGGSLWKLTSEGASIVKTHIHWGSFYKSISDGLWWSIDKTGHGKSKFKVFIETEKGLKWISDADEYGNFIAKKHKSETGKLIPWGQMKTVK